MLQDTEEDTQKLLTDSSVTGDGDNTVDHTVNEEAKREHHQRRQKLTQDLNNLNKMLGMKEELVSKMKASDKNMQALKEEYEVRLSYYFTIYCMQSSYYLQLTIILHFTMYHLELNIIILLAAYHILPL